MMTQPIAILASGMVTGVGLTASATCAAIRCAISNFTETRFMDSGGQWIMGCQVSLEEPWRGRTKLVKMASRAISESLISLQGLPTARIPLFLCVAEQDRPGLTDNLDESLLVEVQVELATQFHPASKLITSGKIGGAVAMVAARQCIQETNIEYCVIAGVDSYLAAGTIAEFEENERILTGENSNGFVPGEAAAAILVGAPRNLNGSGLVCLGVGTSQERATILSEEPLRGDGLVSATHSALSEASQTMNDIDFRISDVSGESYGFKELSLVLNRMLRVRKEDVELWHPADCVGEVGAAIVPLNLGAVLLAIQKGYCPGAKSLCHGGNDTGERATLVLQEVT